MVERSWDKKKWRTILILVGVPVVIVATLFGMKTFHIYFWGAWAQNTYEEQTYSETINAGQNLKIMNFLESWIAYYNAGTGFTADGNLQEGERELKEGLLVVGDNLVGVCLLTANLVTTYELQAEMFELGSLQYNETMWLAGDTVAGAPPDCFPPEEGGVGEDYGLGDAIQRIDDALSGDGDESPTPTGEENENEDGDSLEENIDRIIEHLDDSSEDRSQDNAINNSGERGSRPW